MILAKEPNLVVECGVLDGYSTLYIANALKFNHQSRDIESSFYAYDLFDAYEYNHGDYEKVDEMILDKGLLPYCTIVKHDAFDAAKGFDNEEVDFLHFDISNDGDILLKMLEVWGSKINREGMIAFEGGSIERDQGWIAKYNKRPIRPELLCNPDVYRNWDFQIFDAFPSMTLLWRKR